MSSIGDRVERRRQRRERAVDRAELIESVYDRIARIQAELSDGRIDPAQLSLETQTGPDGAELLLVTLDELHDLTYQAASVTTQRAGVSRGRAQDLAARTAQLSTLLARGHDGYHLGADPRA